MECAVCSAREFETDDAGHRLCLVCYTRVDGAVEEMAAGEDEATTARPAKIYGRAKLMQEKTSQRKPERRTASARDCLRAFQLTLAANARALGPLIGEDAAEAVLAVTRRFWFSFLERWLQQSRYPIQTCFLVEPWAKPPGRRKLLWKSDGDSPEEGEEDEINEAAGYGSDHGSSGGDNDGRGAAGSGGARRNGSAARRDSSSDEELEEEEDGGSSESEDAEQSGKVAAAAPAAAAAAAAGQGQGNSGQGSRRRTRKSRVQEARRKVWHAARRNQEPPTASELVRVSMPLVPALVYAACRWLRSPVAHFDLTRWCRDGALPYIGAYSKLPEALRAAVRPVRQFFCPARAPLAPEVAYLATRLGVALGVQLPPANVPALASRFARAVGLPHQALQILAELCALPWAAASTGWGDATSDLPGLYEWMVRASPAHAVALVMVAARLTNGWEKWRYVRPLAARNTSSARSDGNNAAAASGDAGGGGGGGGGGGSGGGGGDVADGEAVAVPADETELWLLPRGKLPQYLDRCTTSAFYGALDIANGYVGLGSRLAPFLEKAAERVEQEGARGNSLPGGEIAPAEFVGNLIAAKKATGEEAEAEDAAAARAASRAGLKLADLEGRGFMGVRCRKRRKKARESDSEEDAGPGQGGGGYYQFYSQGRTLHYKQTTEESRAAAAMAAAAAVDDGYGRLLEVCARLAELPPHVLEALVVELDVILGWKGVLRRHVPGKHERRRSAKRKEASKQWRERRKATLAEGKEMEADEEEEDEEEGELEDEEGEAGGEGEEEAMSDNGEMAEADEVDAVEDGWDSDGTYHI